MNLTNMTVDEFTTPNPACVEMDTKLPLIWEIMQEKGIRHVLVQENDEIIGMVSERDLITFSQDQEFQGIEAQDIMSKNLLTARPDTKLYEVALEMSQNKYGSTVIQDKDSHYLGIFTATDALNALVEILRGDLTAD